MACECFLNIERAWFKREDSYNTN